jgi:hypothetical protein
MKTDTDMDKDTDIDMNMDTDMDANAVIQRFISRISVKSLFRLPMNVSEVPMSGSL